MLDHMELEEILAAGMDGDVNRCVCCGEIIPEGRQVCPDCENEINGGIQNESKLEGTV